jgi:hypothetical protein
MEWKGGVLAIVDKVLEKLRRLMYKVSNRLACKTYKKAGALKLLWLV